MCSGTVVAAMHQVLKTGFVLQFALSTAACVVVRVLGPCPYGTSWCGGVS